MARGHRVRHATARGAPRVTTCGCHGFRAATARPSSPSRAAPTKPSSPPAKPGAVRTGVRPAPAKPP
eukprot:4051860-Prymnesium_polylepis.1